MTHNLNILAWIAVVCAILLWAVAPRIAEAHVVQFPQVPRITETTLPPFAPNPMESGKSHGG
ncbi:MAG TPA: hypothetical protein VJ928_04545 [Marivita sp.]|nr:hypothetical protein [Marivita sp.]